MISYSLYKFFHVVAILTLVGGLLSLLLLPAVPATRQRRTIAQWVTGSAAAIALVSGFGLHARLGGIWQGWLVVKILSWFVILAVMTRFRAGPPDSLALAWLIVLPVAAAAVLMAIYKPF
ncbi:MAG: hypothetical protein ACREIL_08220 [Nitrospiraceae bacterium]